MINFDYHSHLSPEEFVRLVTDILEIRESGLTFRSYGKSKDGGIDIKCTNSPTLIMGQVKLYQNNYAQLKSSLKIELQKVRKHEPQRYIIATSTTLSPDNNDEIIQLFEGYITHEDDIIDREKLNQYLNQEKYKTIRDGIIPKIIPDINYLADIITDTVNHDIRVRTEDELLNMQQTTTIFVRTQSYQESLQQLIHERVIIQTGYPGLGKTTNARMMVNHLIALNPGMEFIFIRQPGEIDRTFDRKKQQVFFFDDFWGKNFAGIPQKGGEQYPYFISIIERFNKSTSHYLILCSREYIIQTACQENPDIKKHIQPYIHPLHSPSAEERVEILLKHLSAYGYGREYFTDLLFENKILQIIQHPNYTPRHIDYFMRYIVPGSQDITNTHRFYQHLLKYMDNPEDFWRDLINKQSDMAILILVIIFISSGPVLEKDIQTTLANMLKKMNHELGFNLHIMDFDTELKTLENLFIRSQPYEKEIIYSFQSPGIKDFILEYIRKTPDKYKEILLSQACFFNQLYYAFDIQTSEFEDFDEDNPVFGKKILLNAPLQQVLKTKITNDFDKLNFSNIYEREYTHNHTNQDDSYHTKYSKLFTLKSLFDIDENDDLKTFISEQVFSDIEQSANKTTKFIPHQSMLLFPYIISLIKSQFTQSENRTQLIHLYHKNITYANEFLSLYEFSEIFPEEFATYLKENTITIRNHIRGTILFNIYCFTIHDPNDDLEILLDINIKEILKTYNMRLTRNFIKEINQYTDKFQPIQESNSTHTASPQIPRQINRKRRKHQKPAYQKLILPYIGKEEWQETSPKSIVKYITESCTNYTPSSIKNFLRKHPFITAFCTNDYALVMVSDYLNTHNPDAITNRYTFYSGIIENTLNEISDTLFILTTRTIRSPRKNGRIQ